MHQLFSFNTVQSGEGVGQELIYISAAVIGGCLLTGGYGSAIGAVFGAFMFGMVQQGIVYAGWNPDWFKAFLGVMLLGAVADQSVGPPHGDPEVTAMTPRQAAPTAPSSRTPPRTATPDRRTARRRQVLRQHPRPARRRPRRPRRAR